MTPHFVNQGEVLGLVYHKNKETGELLREEESLIKPRFKSILDSNPNWVQCDENGNELASKPKAKKKAKKPKK